MSKDYENELQGQKRKADVELINARCRQHARLDQVSQRAGGGGQLTYIEGNSLIDNMNEVFGSTGWNTRIISQDGALSPNGKWEYMCMIEVSVPAYGATKQDVGYGSGEREKASKEAVTDALKRACRQFGNYFGNSLYDKEHLAALDRERKQKNTK